MTREKEILLKMAKKALSAEVIQGDGRNNMKRYPNCHMRTSLGNCDAIGGFCTSINAPICDAFHKVSRPQGKWMHDGSQWANRWVCDKCGHKIFEPQTNFCPHCGARMKGGAE